MEHANDKSAMAPAPTNRMWDEPDIGSGEKTAGQRETEEIIRQIPALPEEDELDDDASDDADDYEDSAAPDGETDAANMEQELSLDKDEPSSRLDDLDPVPPRG